MGPAGSPKLLVNSYFFALEGSATSKTSGATLLKIRCTFLQTFASNILKIFARASIILQIVFAFSAAAPLIDSQTNSKLLNALIVTLIKQQIKTKRREEKCVLCSFYFTLSCWQVQQLTRCSWKPPILQLNAAKFANLAKSGQTK